jgi:hypothetical protein
MGSNDTAHTGRGRVAPIALLVAGLVLAGCGGDDDDSGADASQAFDQTAEEAAAEEPAELLAAGDGAIATQAPEQGGSDASDPGGFDLGIVGRDVIVEMHVLMSSDDIARSVASITASAAQLGGGIASSNVDYGDPSASDGPSGHAVLVVKVPPDQVDRLVSGLETTGSVRSIEQSAQDVTEQLVDLDVRIDNARESVVNVRSLMDQATALTDLVTLESELTRRQTELEQLEAQQRNLGERVALATVTVEVLPTDDVPAADDGSDTLGDAVGDGWRAFATFLFAIVYLVAILLPFLLVGLVVLAVIGWIVRRRRTAEEARRVAADRAPVPVVGAQADDASPTPVGPTTGGSTHPPG